MDSSSVRLLSSSTARIRIGVPSGRVLGPGLGPRKKERRGEAVETLETLAAVVSQLKHLLLVQDLRRLVG